MLPVKYICVQDEDGEEVAWAVLLNGKPIAVDIPNTLGLTCRNIAENLAEALGTSVEEETIAPVSLTDVKDVLGSLW